MSLPVNVLNQIRARKSKYKGFRKKPPVWQYPHSVEREYRKELRNYVKFVSNEIRKRLIDSQLESLVEQANALRPDRLDDYLDDLDGIVERTREAITERTAEVIAILDRIAQQVNERNLKEFDKLTRTVFGVNIFVQEPWLGAQLKNFAQQNAVLIKDVSDQLISNVANIAQRGLANGETAGAIAKEIRDRFGFADNRAKLIAQDQISKLNGQLTRLRQKEIGVTNFVWRTSLDERVRPSHAVLNGRVFSWDKPPDVGIPGSPIRCRCSAEAFLDDIVDNLRG